MAVEGREGSREAFLPGGKKSRGSWSFRFEKNERLELVHDNEDISSCFLPRSFAAKCPSGRMGEETQFSRLPDVSNSISKGPAIFVAARSLAKHSVPFETLSPFTSYLPPSSKSDDLTLRRDRDEHRSFVVSKIVYIWLQVEAPGVLSRSHCRRPEHLSTSTLTTAW